VQLYRFPFQCSLPYTTTLLMRVHAISRPGNEPSLDLLRSMGFDITSSPDFVAGTNSDLLVILGGDGTIHRFLPDLLRSAVPVLVVPCGSGNDFARALGITSVEIALQLVREFARGNARIREADLGIIADGSGKQTPFCCTGGVGLDAVAAQFANHLPQWVRAHGGYLLGAMRAAFANPILELTVRANTAAGDHATRKRCCLFAFANTPSFGGGLRIAPGARLSDGQLDCVLVEAMSRPRLARAMISLLKATHLRLKEVHSMRSERLRIETNPPTQVYADGEYVCETPVEVRVWPRALRVLHRD